MSSPDPRRRTLLVSAVLVGGIGVAGCRVQAESDAPNIPGLPRAEPIPGEADLRYLLSQYRDTAILNEQRRALRRALLQCGLTVAQVDEPVSGHPNWQVGSLQEGQALRAAIADTPPALYSVAAGIGAQRISQEALASAKTPPPASSTRHPGAQPPSNRFSLPNFQQASWPAPALTTWKNPEAAGRFYALAREAQGLVQVNAGVTPTPQRDQISATTTMLATLARWATSVAAGATPTPTLGYDGPSPADPTAARAAIRNTLTQLQGSLAGLVQESNEDREAVLLLTHALGRVSAYGRLWGGPQMVLPGFRATPAGATASPSS